MSCAQNRNHMHKFLNSFFFFFLKFQEGFVLYESSNCSFDLHSQKNRHKSKKFLTKPKLSSKSNHCCATTNFHQEENCTIKPWATHPKLGNASPLQGALVWTLCLIHRCVCIWQYILQKLQLQTTFPKPLYISHC